MIDRKRNRLASFSSCGAVTIGQIFILGKRQNPVLLSIERRLGKQLGSDMRCLFGKTISERYFADLIDESRVALAQLVRQVVSLIGKREDLPPAT